MSSVKIENLHFTCVHCKEKNKKEVRLQHYWINEELSVFLCPLVEECIYPFGSLELHKFFFKWDSNRSELRMCSPSDVPNLVDIPKILRITNKSDKPSELYVFFEEGTNIQMEKKQSSQLWWENKKELCWLHPTLCLLVNNKTFQHYFKSENFGNCHVKNFSEAYIEAVSSSNLSKPSRKSSVLTHGIPLSYFKKVRETTFDYLQPYMLCETYKEELPVIPVVLLLKENINLHQLFLSEFSMELMCDNCGHEEASQSKTTFVFIPGTVKKIKKNCIIYDCQCSQCGSEGQKILQFHNFSPFLLVHFVEGLPSNDLAAMDFLHGGQMYGVRGFVQHNQSNQHFVPWIRCDKEGKQWKCCDDLDPLLQNLTAQLPAIPASEIHIVMWEQRETSNENIRGNIDSLSQVVKGMSRSENETSKTSKKKTALHFQTTQYSELSYDTSLFGKILECRVILDKLDVEMFSKKRSLGKKDADKEDSCSRSSSLPKTSVKAQKHDHSRKTTFPVAGNAVEKAPSGEPNNVSIGVVISPLLHNMPFKKPVRRQKNLGSAKNPSTKQAEASLVSGPVSGQDSYVEEPNMGTIIHTGQVYHRIMNSYESEHKRTGENTLQTDSNIPVTSNVFTSSIIAEDQSVANSVKENASVHPEAVLNDTSLAQLNSLVAGFELKKSSPYKVISPMSSDSSFTTPSAYDSASPRNRKNSPATVIQHAENLKTQQPNNLGIPSLKDAETERKADSLRQMCRSAVSSSVKDHEENKDGTKLTASDLQKTLKNGDPSNTTLLEFLGDISASKDLYQATDQNLDLSVNNTTSSDKGIKNSHTVTDEGRSFCSSELTSPKHSTLNIKKPCAKVIGQRKMNKETPCAKVIGQKNMNKKKTCAKVIGQRRILENVTTIPEQVAMNENETSEIKVMNLKCKPDKTLQLDVSHRRCFQNTSVVDDSRHLSKAIKEKSVNDKGIEPNSIKFMEVPVGTQLSVPECCIKGGGLSVNGYTTQVRLSTSSVDLKTCNKRVKSAPQTASKRQRKSACSNEATEQSATSDYRKQQDAARSEQDLHDRESYLGVTAMIYDYNAQHRVLNESQSSRSSPEKELGMVKNHDESVSVCASASQDSTIGQKSRGRKRKCYEMQNEEKFPSLPENSDQSGTTKGIASENKIRLRKNTIVPIKRKSKNTGDVVKMNAVQQVQPSKSNAETQSENQCAASNSDIFSEEKKCISPKTFPLLSSLSPENRSMNFKFNSIPRCQVFAFPFLLQPQTLVKYILNFKGGNWNSV